MFIQHIIIHHSRMKYCSVFNVIFQLLWVALCYYILFYYCRTHCEARHHSNMHSVFFVSLFQESERANVHFIASIFMKSQLVLLVEWKKFYQIKEEEIERKLKRKWERKRESLMRFSWIINVYAFAIGFTKIAHTCTTTHTHELPQRHRKGIYNFAWMEHIPRHYRNPFGHPWE